MKRFCPQCGDRIAFSSTASQKNRAVNAEGFCMASGKRPGPRDNGCNEHIRRFDPETGRRLEALPRRGFLGREPWDMLREVREDTARFEKVYRR